MDIKKDNANLIKLDIISRPQMDIPCGKQWMPSLIKKVTETYTSPSCSLTLDQVIDKELQDVYATFCKTFLDETILDIERREKEAWESDEYSYILAESNVGLDYIFEIEHDLDNEPRCQPNEKKYESNKLNSLGIEILDFTYCKVNHGWDYHDYIGNDPLIHSVGSIGERSGQIDRDESWNQEFYHFFDLIAKENQQEVNDYLGYEANFNGPSSSIYTDMSYEHPDYYINYAELYEAIVDAEQEQQSN